MIEINLLSSERHKKGASTSRKLALPHRSIFILILLFIFVCDGTLFGFFYYFAQERDALSGKLEFLRPDLSKLGSLKQKAIDAKKGVHDLNQLIHQPFYMTHLLNAISDSMTNEVWLNEVVIRDRENTRGMGRKDDESDQPKRQERELVLKGTSSPKLGGAAAASSFVDSLKQNKTLASITRDVSLERIDRKDSDGHVLFEFVVICPIEVDS
jgi:hypothetical protein